MIIKYKIIFASLVSAVLGTCESSDLESMIGGYTGKVHGIGSTTFALEPTSLDLVVAGQMTKKDLSFGFIYYQ